MFAARVGSAFVLIVLLAMLPPVICGGVLVLVGALAVGAAYEAIPTPLGITLMVTAMVILRGSFSAIRIAWQRSVIFRRVHSRLLSLADQVHYDLRAQAWAYRSSDGATQHFSSQHEATAFAAAWAARRHATARKPLPTDDRHSPAPRHTQKEPP